MLERFGKKGLILTYAWTVLFLLITIILLYNPSSTRVQLLSETRTERRCFITSSFFGYEQPNPPPKGLPNDFINFYITDNGEHARVALASGFNFAIIDKTAALSLQFALLPNQTGVGNWTDAQKLGSGIMCRAKFAPQIFYHEIFREGCGQVWYFDGNVKSFNKTFFEENLFAVNKSKALYLDIGHYALPYNLVSELEVSLVQQRWQGYVEGMNKSSLEYFKQLENRLGPQGLAHCPVASAKYVGWNLRHPMLPVMSEWLMEQCKMNYQGNIVLSHLACMMKDSVQSRHVFTDDSHGVVLRAHGDAD